MEGRKEGNRKGPPLNRGRNGPSLGSTFAEKLGFNSGHPLRTKDEGMEEEWKKGGRKGRERGNGRKDMAGG
jgi:hypothetical protein